MGPGFDPVGPQSTKTDKHKRYSISLITRKKKANTSKPQYHSTPIRKTITKITTTKKDMN